MPSGSELTPGSPVGVTYDLTSAVPPAGTKTVTELSGRSSGTLLNSASVKV
jgi:hypothetical protein